METDGDWWEINKTLLKIKSNAWSMDIDRTSIETN